MHCKLYTCECIYLLPHGPDTGLLDLYMYCGIKNDRLIATSRTFHERLHLQIQILRQITAEQTRTSIQNPLRRFNTLRLTQEAPSGKFV